LIGRDGVVTRDEIKRANATATRRRNAGPTAVSARYDRRTGRVVVRLTSGLDVRFSPRDIQGLETAKPAQLDAIEITPSGPDLYLPALLAAK